MKEMGGTAGVMRGNLKRRLLSANIMQFSPGEAGSGPVSVQLVLSGLCNLVDVQVACGGYQIIDDNQVPLAPEDWPVGAGTIQIIPQSAFPGAPKLQFREVFQDPTAVTNANFPLPEDLPFSWNMPGECDEAIIVITLDRDAWQGSGLTGGVIVQATAEYFGPWWDADAYRLAMGQIALSPPSKPLIFTT